MEILYSDKDITVCIKEIGTDAEHGVPAALSAALGGEFYPVHRLDLNVGGVMVYARTRAAAAALSRAVQNGEMVKEYLARAHGILPESGVLEDFLFKDAKKNKVFVVRNKRVGSKFASLAFRRLFVTGGEAPVSLVQIRLHTGRSHQIRVQLASRGFPLVGDSKYGARDKEKVPALFATRISFPYEGRPFCFEARPSWAEDALLYDIE